MKIRASRISASISRAIHQDEDSRAQEDGRNSRILRAILAFFSFFRLVLTRYRPADFLALRRTAWQLDEDEYLDSFHAPYASAAELVPVGDLGYSGSTFFATQDNKFLVKSLPRRFEHQFFTHDLFQPYLSHNTAYPDSLLVRITDMVYASRPSLGAILGTAPSHHIVMENLLYGKTDEHADRWESFDLKPADYFFPERDIADGRLAPQRVKDNLVDMVPHKITIPPAAKRSLMDLLSRDTRLLASHSAVDYSLFLVRYPQSLPSPPKGPGNAHHPSPWREGVDDVQGEWRYRALVLDFFWAKRKLRAKAMTGLVQAFNVIFTNKGPMSITAEPEEYRQRFLRMVDSIFVGTAAEDVDVEDQASL